MNGRRYIGDGITGKARLTLKGTPGNDMAAFMNGLEAYIEGNAQDSIGNTMGKLLPMEIQAILSVMPCGAEFLYCGW